MQSHFLKLFMVWSGPLDEVKSWLVRLLHKEEDRRPKLSGSQRRSHGGSMQMATYGIQTRGVQPQGIVGVLHEQIMSLETQKMDARWQFVRNVICKAKLRWSTCFQGVDFGVFVSRAKQLHYN
jgi:hypothetical protein